MGLGALAMFGSMFTQIPALLGTMQATKQAWDMAQKWSKQTDPAKYQQSGWAAGDYASVPTRVNTGINDFIAGSNNAEKLNSAKNSYAQLFADQAKPASSYNGYFKG